MKGVNFNHWALSLAIVLILVSACKKDPDDNPEPENHQTDDSTLGALVLNEGNFNRGNASLDYYNPDSQTLVREVFEATNDRPLGDVLHSVTFDEDWAYLVVNNSGKIEVMNLENFEANTTITNLPSPRYLRVVDDNTAYVTNFTQGNESEISIIDLNNYEKTGSIATGGWTEQMAMAAGKVFVTEVKAGHLLVINPDNQTITDTISLSVETQSVFKDQASNIWCLANGGINGEEQPRLYRVNPESHQVMNSFGFNDQASPSNLTGNGNGDTLYYLKDGIYRMPINAGSLPAEAFVESRERNFYGLDVHPENGEVYATDALDYARRGDVYRFDSKTGDLVDSFKAGMIPKGVRYLEKD